jgi:putative ABC transport system ATP-binding protein
MKSILSVKNVTKKYAKGPAQIMALRGVSLDVRPGEFLAVVGRSGSGKSTLLNVLGGLDEATSGSIFVNGKDIAKMKRPELALHRRRTVGMIFQSFNLIPSRTARENVELALAFNNVGRKERREKAVRLLTSLGLGERMDHLPSELSGGEAQRVAVARALANDPSVLLADEPTGNLDSATSAEILNLLQSLNRDRNLTVVMVTHDKASARRVARRTVEFLDGRIVRETGKGRRS